MAVEIEPLSSVLAYSVLIEQSARLESVKGVSVGRVLVNGENAIARVLILNPGSRSQHVRPGTIIGITVEIEGEVVEIAEMGETEGFKIFSDQKEEEEQGVDIASRINKNFTPIEIDGSMRVLHDFKVCFARSEEKLGSCTATEHIIPTKVGGMPIYQNHQASTYQEREIVQEKIQMLVKMGWRNQQQALGHRQ